MISFVIPCHSESENLSTLYVRVVAVMERKLPNHDDLAVQVVLTDRVYATQRSGNVV